MRKPIESQPFTAMDMASNAEKSQPAVAPETSGTGTPEQAPLYICPVCFYPGMPFPPCDYEICACCATEFGNDDESLSHKQLRANWIGDGMKWFFGNPPNGWDPKEQLNCPTKSA